MWEETLLLEGSDLNREFDPDQPFAIAQVSAEEYTLSEWQSGVETADGQRVRWVGNQEGGRVEVEELVSRIPLTLENYSNVLNGQEFEIQDSEGNVKVEQGGNLFNSFMNSIVVAIPATILPILIAAFAAYAFAWMNFPFRRVLFVLVIALLVVPLQIALVPLLLSYGRLNINGTFLAVWLAHTGFGLPLATYLLYNYISALPKETLESAFIDGASHYTVFMRLILPLSVPALASFCIFQFLWVWNDYLVALIFLSGTNEVLTMSLAQMVGSRGNDWHLLTAGAFVSMIMEGILTDAGYEESAVNILNTGHLIPELPEWLAVEVPAIVDKDGLHGVAVERPPSGFLGLLRNQVAVHDLTADAILHQSRELALQALLVDPIVGQYHGVEDMLDTMIAYQEEFLGYLK